MTNFKAKKIIIYLIVGIILIIGAFQLCKSSIANADINSDTDTNDISYVCGIHDSSYVEPTIENGIFVCSDTNLRFIVSDNTVQLIGDEEAIRKILLKKYVGHISSADGSDISEEAIDSELEFWKVPQKYTITTLHELTEKTQDNLDVEAVYMVVPFEYSISNNLSIAIINENTLEYLNTYFSREVSFNDIEKAIINGTDVFSAEAYISPIDIYNDEYTILCSIINKTSDKISVGLYDNFFLCYSSNLSNPTATDQIMDITFLPNERKFFYFNVQKELIGKEENKIIYGSCVLEINNSDKYNCFNVLKLEPYTIERNKNEKNT